MRLIWYCPNLPLSRTKNGTPLAFQQRLQSATIDVSGAEGRPRQPEEITVTQEQEAAAKWQMFEEYKRLVGRQAALEGKLRPQVAGAYRSSRRMEAVLNPDDFQMSMLGEFPERSQLAEILQEMEEISGQLGRLRGNLRRAGMENL